MSIIIIRDITGKQWKNLIEWWPETDLIRGITFHHGGDTIEWHAKHWSYKQVGGEFEWGKAHRYDMVV